MKKLTVKCTFLFKMSLQKITVLTNIYNEEYLLPFWLIHHRDIFDHGIIIDYRSTDRSVEICKKICPTWTVITTRNRYFDAEDIDKEFMDIENTINGAKIVLNTTEFIFSKKPLCEYFSSNDTKSLAIKAFSPHTLTEMDPKNIHDLYDSFLSRSVLYRYDRGVRQLHNYKNGSYGFGRHQTNNPHIEIDDIVIIWLGYFPLNENMWKRKLQIKENISEMEHKKGFGFHHLWDKSVMISYNNEKVNTGLPLLSISKYLHTVLSEKIQNKTFVVTGGCGFIGSHMVDKLIYLKHKVVVIDNLSNGSLENLNKDAIFENVDIRNFSLVLDCMSKYKIDGIFHFAAIARTPWCIENPLLAYETNVMGTLNILESARIHKIQRIVVSSSNVVYAFLTPYRTSKEAVEGLANTYRDMYGMSVISLRYSNVYGKRQSENGPSPNVFAALRKSKKENGYLTITGDGTQTRNYTHVSDIVSGNLLAMFSNYSGTIDLCTGISIPLNQAASYFNCDIKYIDERPGDIKHIVQCPDEAFRVLGWKHQIQLEEGIKDVL